MRFLSPCNHGELFLCCLNKSTSKQCSSPTQQPFRTYPRNLKTLQRYMSPFLSLRGMSTFHVRPLVLGNLWPILSHGFQDGPTLRESAAAPELLTCVSPSLRSARPSHSRTSGKSSLSSPALPQGSSVPSVPRRCGGSVCLH